MKPFHSPEKGEGREGCIYPFGPFCLHSYLIRAELHSAEELNESMARRLEVTKKDQEREGQVKACMQSRKTSG